MKILLKGGRVIDPFQGLDDRREVLVEAGRILDLVSPGQEGAFARDARIIDVSGLTVTPGLIDMHVHLREPGQEHKETIKSGTAAAAAGGFTTVAAMPNTNPVNDRASVTRLILDRAREAGMARVLPVAAMTEGSLGETLSDYKDLARAGAVAVSDDGRWVKDSRVMRQVLTAAGTHGLRAISHAEDMNLTVNGVMNEGTVSRRLGFSGMPGTAEDVAVFRDIRLAHLTGVPIHLAHVSTAASVELIRQAKAAGLPVTAETAPHYFTLTDEAVASLGSLAKMNPPLRTEDDRQAIRQGLADGTLDAIATDHAPHSTEEKSRPFEQAPFGIIGLETALPLTLTLVRDGVLTLAGAVAALSLNPAKILGLESGRLTVGAPADLTVIDPESPWRALPDDFRSMARNTPFGDWPMKGRAVMTLVGGRVTGDGRIGM